jgi:uncharacterized protein (TIRG00374 family)
MFSGLLRFALKLIVSAAVVWLVVRQLNFSDVVSRLEAVSTGGSLLVILVLLTQCVVTSMRWEWIVRMLSFSFPFSAALRTWLIGHFLGQGFPSTVGQDAFRVMIMRRSGIPTMSALEIVLLDRFAGVVGLVLLATATLPILVKLSTDTSLLIPLSIILIGAIAAIALIFSQLRLSSFLSGFAGLAFLSQLRANLKRLVETRRQCMLLLGTSLAAHLLTVLAAYVIARDGLTQITVLQCLAIVPPAILMSLIPVSIAGWGVREGSMVAGAMLLGIPTAEALFVSLMLGLGFLVVGLIGGLVWLVGGSTYLTAANAENFRTQRVPRGD